MLSQKGIAGIFTPTMVPLDGNGDINELELSRYIDWLIGCGVNGLYLNGSTGEFTRFTPDERRRITQIICSQAGDRVPVLAGAAEANVSETLSACEQYLGYGARAVAIVSPYYYRLSQSAVYAYFREIAVNSPIDITLYNIPIFATPIEVDTIRRLAEFPRVVGIKDSSGDISSMLSTIGAIRPSRPEFASLTGCEPAFVPMLIVGCHGATLALSVVVPEVTAHILRLATSGNAQTALKIQCRLTELFDHLLAEADFPDGIRAAVEARGFKFGAGRHPRAENSLIDLRQLSLRIEILLSEMSGL